MQALFICRMKTNRYRNFLLSYFTFTRAEKHAGIFLTAFLLILQTSLWCRYYILSPDQHFPMTNPTTVLKTVKSSAHRFEATTAVETKRRLSFFPFDPDTVGVETLTQLGMSEKQAASMIKFREKLGGFKDEKQLSKVRVLRAELLDQWKPWLRFGVNANNAASRPIVKAVVSKARPPLVEINRADTNQLMDLPFIGAGRARAIVNYRNKLGGYIRKEQLLEIKIIPDSVYQIILPRISCDGLVFRPLDLNRCSADSLKHPYLPKALARIIVNYREQHGPFTAIGDLEKLPLVNAEILTKLAPYLKINP